MNLGNALILLHVLVQICCDIRSLQIVSELDIGNVSARRMSLEGLDTKRCANKDAGPKEE